MLQNVNLKLPPQTALWLHFLISLVVLPLADTQGEAFKLLFAPYVVFLVVTLKKEHLPALIVLSSGTSIVSFVILLSCLFTAIYKYSILGKSTLVWVFWIFMGFFPVFINDYVDQFLDKGIIKATTKYSFYFGLMPIFYGYVLYRKEGNFDLQHWALPIIVFFFVAFFGIKFTAEALRVPSFAQVLFPVAGLALLISKNKIPGIFRNYRWLSYLVLISVALGLIKLKFHHTLSVLLAIGLFITMKKRLAWVLIFYNPLVLSGLLVGMVALAISFAHDLGGKVNLDEIDYSNFSSYPAFIQEKLFGDRGVIWAGAWEHILLYTETYPPEDEVTFDFMGASGAYVANVEFGAHNMVMESILRLGLWGGITVSAVWLLSTFLLIRAFIRNKSVNAPALFIAVTFGVSLGGGLTGQYILMPNFSFLLMAAIGAMIGYTDYWHAAKGRL